MLARPAAYLVCACVLILTPRAAQAELTQPKLAVIVRRAIREDPDSVVAPEFWSDCNFLYYKFGYLRRNPATLREPRPLRELPIDTQYRGELIRRMRWSPDADRIWGSHLVRIEQAVGDELDLLSHPPATDQELSGRMNELLRMVDGILTAAVNAIAFKEGKVAVPTSVLVVRCRYVPMTSHQPFLPPLVPQYGYPVRAVEESPSEFTVHFTTTPTDSRKFYLLLAEYWSHQETPTYLADYHNWNGIPDESWPLPPGRYRFMVLHQGVQETSAVIRISQNHQRVDLP